MHKKAFTLIELLVVIAIIAILAAILFPVFAQAKVAAKKATSISNVKQQGTCTAIYLSDNDDLFPLSCGFYTPLNQWMWNYWHDVPADWRTNNGDYVNFAGGSAQNSTQPYRKNYQMLELAGGFRSFMPFGYTGQRAVKTGLAYNGLLHAWSSTAVNAPSNLPLFTQTGGNLNADGADTGPLPYIYCATGNVSCVYQRGTNASCNGFGAGTWSGFFYPNASQWIYGHAQTWVFTDTSAKARNVGMTINSTNNAKTDFHTDPYTSYQANAVDNFTAWYDQYYCHALLFQPDFDFSSWPLNPFAGY